MFKTAQATMLNRTKQVISSIQISKIVVHAIVTRFKIIRVSMYFSQQNKQISVFYHATQLQHSALYGGSKRQQLS